MKRSDMTKPSRPSKPSKPSKPAVASVPSRPSTPSTPAVPPRKIALIGKAPSSALLAPYDDPSWEVWTLSTLASAKEVPRWDRHFELHDLRIITTETHGNYRAWMTEQKKPIFFRDAPPPEFPSGIQYPLGEILRSCSHLAGVRYLTNTVSMMLALAIYEHVQLGMHISEIGLWGIDMAQHGLAKGGNNGPFTSEYARQRPSVEYWVGIVEGIGIHVIVPEQSDLLKTACIYGYQHTESFLKFHARQNELHQRIAHAQQREESAHNEAVYLSGALEGGTYYEQWLCGTYTDDKPKTLGAAK